MKKLTQFFAFTIFIFSAFFAQAQYDQPTRIFGKKQNDLYATIGLVPTFLADDSRQILPPLSLTGKFMVSPHVSLGGTFGHSITHSSIYNYSDIVSGKWVNRYYEFGARVALHVTRFDNMEIYGGFNFSYHVSHIKPTDDKMLEYGYHQGIPSSTSKFLPGGFVGFGYALSKKVSWIAEIGYGVSIFKTGLGYKI